MKKMNMKEGAINKRAVGGAFNIKNTNFPLIEELLLVEILSPFVGDLSLNFVKI